MGLGGLADQLDDAEGDEDVHQQVEREELHQPEGHLPGQPPPRHAGSPERARRRQLRRRVASLGGRAAGRADGALALDHGLRVAAVRALRADVVLLPEDLHEALAHQPVQPLNLLQRRAELEQLDVVDALPRVAPGDAEQIVQHVSLEERPPHADDALPPVVRGVGELHVVGGGQRGVDLLPAQEAGAARVVRAQRVLHLRQPAALHERLQLPDRERLRWRHAAAGHLARQKNRAARRLSGFFVGALGTEPRSSRIEPLEPQRLLLSRVGALEAAALPEPRRHREARAAGRAGSARTSLGMFAAGENGRVLEYKRSTYQAGSARSWFAAVPALSQARRISPSVEEPPNCAERSALGRYQPLSSPLV